MDLLNKLVAAVREHDATSVRSIIEQNGVDAKEANKLLESINLTLHSCAQCRKGVLEMALRQGMADKTKVTQMGREPLSSGFVTALGTIHPQQHVKNS